MRTRALSFMVPQLNELISQGQVRSQISQRRQTWGTRFSQCALDQLDCPRRVVDFDDQFVVALIVQVDHDGFVRMVNVPKHTFSVLVESSRGDDSGNVGSGQADAVIPAVCYLRVGANAGDMNERNLEAAFEGPELVRAANVQCQFAF